MLLKPRHFLLSGSVGLLLSVILFSYYRIGALPVEQVARQRAAQRPSPEAQLLSYYHDFPDRYIRVSKENWQYEQKSRTAYHSFTLRNVATVAYHSIEVLLKYQTAGGKTLRSQVVKVAGPLAPGKSLVVGNVVVKNVPADCDSVVVTVSKALIY